MLAILLRVMLQLCAYLADDRVRHRALCAAGDVGHLLGSYAVVSATVAVEFGRDLLE